MHKTYLTGIICLLSLLVGCGGEEAAPAVTADAAATDVVAAVTATRSSGAVLVEPTATATAIPEPATATSPAATNVAATATPLGADIPEPAPPADPGNLTMPPYVASACSDRFPCNDDVAAWEERIVVPAGFQATYVAHFAELHPTAITAGRDGLLYVAMQEGDIYTVDDTGQTTLYVTGFISPTGLAFRPGSDDLYVSSRVIDDWSGLDGESQIAIVRDGEVTPIITGLPCCYTGMHAANDIEFGPDGYGYVGVGARGNSGEHVGPDGRPEIMPFEASILRFSPDGSEVEWYAAGLRNPYGIAWDGLGNLFATDNAPDYGPPDELHRVIPGGQHGYPWYECDTCFSAPPDVYVINPIYNFIPHSAPAGMTAYLGDQFPGYQNHLFVTLWSAFEGASQVMRFEPGGVNAANFVVGLAAPIDVTEGLDGSLYVVDWATGILFQISYIG